MMFKNAEENLRIYITIVITSWFWISFFLVTTFNFGSDKIEVLWSGSFILVEVKVNIVLRFNY